MSISQSTEEFSKIALAITIWGGGADRKGRNIKIIIFPSISMSTKHAVLWWGNRRAIPLQLNFERVVHSYDALVKYQNLAVF